MGSKWYPAIYTGNFCVLAQLAHQDAEQVLQGAEAPGDLPGPQLSEQGQQGDGEHGGHGEKPEASNAPSKACPPSLERAKEQYAQVHGMDASAVTEELLAKTDEGVEGWACRGLDCRAHGPLGNALYRAFRKNPTMAKTYRWLFDDLKVKFRQNWAMARSFDFVSTKRVHSISTTTKHEEVGTWKNQLQLEAHFGGVGIKEAERQAKNYIRNCQQFEERLSKI